MPYSKHTDIELLAASYNCIGDLLKELSFLSFNRGYPKADALRDELRKRTRSVTFETGRTHGE